MVDYSKMKEQDMPLASVVIPSYNHEQFVQDAIKSVVNQTYPNIELIVIDDGSKDSSPQLLKELQKQYGFTLICREENKGLPATLNEGIYNYAKGEYIRALSSDDFMPEDSIAIMINYFENNPKKVLAFGGGYGVDADKNIIQKIEKDMKEEDINFYRLLEKNFIMATAAMYSRDAFMEVGGYDEDLLFEDWSLWLKIIYKYPDGVGCLSNSHLTYYRCHGNNVSSNKEKMAQYDIQVIKKWEDYIPPLMYKKILYNKLFWHFRLITGSNKIFAKKLLRNYKFDYISASIVKDFFIGFGKILFYNNKSSL